MGNVKSSNDLSDDDEYETYGSGTVEDPFVRVKKGGSNNGYSDSNGTLNFGRYSRFGLFGLFDGCSLKTYKDFSDIPNGTYGLIYDNSGKYTLYIGGTTPSARNTFRVFEKYPKTAIPEAIRSMLPSKFCKLNKYHNIIVTGDNFEITTSDSQSFGRHKKSKGGLKAVTAEIKYLKSI